MRPRRPQPPPSEGRHYAALVRASDAYAFWCDASHAVRLSQTIEGLRLQTVARPDGAALGPAGRDPRAVHLTTTQLRELLDTSWLAVSLVGEDYHVPVALIAASNRDAAAVLHDAGEPLWVAPAEPTGPPTDDAQEGGDTAG
jgi:hypothetical protein